MDYRKILDAILLGVAVLGVPATIYAIISDWRLSLISLPIVLGAAAYLYYLRQRDPFQFESIENDVTLDIVDKSGALVKYTKRSRISVIKNNTEYYTESMSVDGVLDSFEVTPGVVEEVRKEEGKVFVRSSFGRVLMKNDQIERTFHARFNNSFRNEREYWVQRQVYPTRRFVLNILFPQDRPYKHFQSKMIRGAYETDCTQPQERIIDGRPALVWVIEKPGIKEDFKISWVW